MTAQEKYAKSEKGKATRKAWRAGNRDKIRKWKRDWAASPAGRTSARQWYKKSPAAMFDLYRKSAERRGLAFELDRVEFLRIVACPCTYCGAQPPADTKRNGLDRVDNSVGYTAQNIVPCCYPCNQMKGTRTRQEFLDHVATITRFQRRLQ